MSNLHRCLHTSPAPGIVFFMCLSAVSMAQARTATADDGAAAASVPVPQEDVMSSLKQAFKQDFDHQVVRGRFDVGSSPDVVHRYYCLVDARTGRTQPNGVAGEPYPRADGMTGIKGTAVSLYSCASAERLGLLETNGFVLTGTAAARVAEPSPTAAAATPPASPATSQTAATASGAPTTLRGADSAADGIDVAGVRLGMTLDAVRQLLRSRKLLDYRESTSTLGHPGASGGVTAAAAGTGFVNVVTAWTTPVDGDGEAYEIMFTPVPGRERVMAIIHSVAYSSARAVRESVLDAGLVKKYGGFSAADGLPAAPTWRVQNTGDIRTGDSCKRRGLFGGLAAVGAGDVSRPNLALLTTPDEFRYQIDECGVAIVTEDHVTAPGGGSREERPITRFTVTAYSPSIAFEGATAAAEVMLVGQPGAVSDIGAVRGKEPVPDL